MNPGKNIMINKTVRILGAGCIMGYLLATILPTITHDAAHASPAVYAQDQHPQAAAKAENVVVSYTYETSSNTTSGDNALAVRSIEFYPNYVLVRASNGTTTLLAVERLQQFSYRPADIK